MKAAITITRPSLRRKWGWAYAKPTAGQNTGVIIPDQPIITGTILQILQYIYQAEAEPESPFGLLIDQDLDIETWYWDGSPVLSTVIPGQSWQPGLRFGWPGWKQAIRVMVDENYKS